ncbi:glycoside hydrolase family 3 C-terminal domain-containing protein [Isoptericola sp. NEAU-Y5]|uniref:Glycoside hydrolase family 3 C-terminal domain-containing protein n=1 Tax=Isoptericola luteus TaxID=2879484 RepID=A0ABS7ZFM2_9MICO|nr:glycoside hydrolase family 3 C-terminal domain-containing protein [Isoptericola sp. NEAU-Y5]MCA5893819.1 glycoside hydrolase family 3 C-terminal domain-containing protein [Isoptericola sp. NEAU-Y5]
MDVPPFRDHRLPTAERARDLLSRLTPSERVAMLHQHAPAVTRLGLAPFHTGCEALHGVAWLGRATVFPQPVGLAATWDAELVRRVGDAVATEVRAKHEADPSVSLNVWAPVVNTLRHPAWGRNEEGYSEDPHLTAHLATAYCRGLRGDHDRVWKTVPTLKHFLAYNNETDRSSTSSDIPPHTLHEEELPAFREPVEAGVAGAVMPAYNQVNGVPAHLQAELFDELRSWSEHSVALVSDAAAPTFLVSLQRACPDRASGNAAMVRAGVDSFTDDDADARPTIERIEEALDRGLLTAEDVDRSVLRLLELRLRTGEMDGDADPYAGTGTIDLPAHRELAREAAARGVVVLRNDAGVLPFGAPGSVAVVGPLADAVLTDWYSGTPPYAVSLADGLRERPGTERVEVATGADVVALRVAGDGAYVTVSEDGATVVADGVDAGKLARFDVTDWGDGVLTLRSAASGRLLTGAAWPVRADADRVGGWEAQEIFRRHVHADGSWSLLHLGSGRWVRVQRGTGVVCAEARTLDEAARFVPRLLESGAARVAEVAARCDTVVVAVGNDPHVAGRETQDRPHLLLPDAAVEVWRAAVEANPRAVLAIVSSYPYVLGPGVADASTVVWSSHAGQELGHGLADVLTGAVEPTGRLAQTWPARPEQAGDLFDYDTRRQQVTYRHLPADEGGVPTFAFGHGLTYGTVGYGELALTAGVVTAPRESRDHPPLHPAGSSSTHVVTARVTVRNTGDRRAEELVQVYSLGCPTAPLPTPVRLLLGYRRVVLAPGDEAVVEIPFDVARLGVWDGVPDGGMLDGALRVQPGEYTVAAGASSADLPVRCRLTVEEPSS